MSQLRLGMHLHRLEGSWMAHPLWKTRFAIHSADDLQRLHDSGVEHCWIDEELGSGIAPPAAAVVAGAAPAVAAPAPAAVPPPRVPATRSMNEEMRQAAALCHRGRDAVVAMFAQARMGRAVDAESCLPLVDDIVSSVGRNAGALVSLARLKSRDDYSYMHSVAVCALMVALARQREMSDDACREAGLAGLMHDIGKAQIPAPILNKPGRLTETEFLVVRKHAELGHALLADAGVVTLPALDVVLHHHEKFDGSGYPHGLAGDAISTLARMGAICDVYDAITSNRPYKTGWDPAESIARMAAWKGHFDARMLTAFVRSLGIYPVGSVVQLESHRLAVVVETNAQNLMAPVVKVFYSGKAKLRIAPLLLDLSRPGCGDRISGRDSGAHGVFQNLDELWLAPELSRRMQAA